MKIRVSIGMSSRILMQICSIYISWWRYQMETFSALLALCAGNSPVPGEFPAHRPVTRSFDVFFDLCLNKRLTKQSWGWWFETQSGSLWRHCNVYTWIWYIDLWMRITDKMPTVIWNLSKFFSVKHYCIRIVFFWNTMAEHYCIRITFFWNSLRK